MSGIATSAGRNVPSRLPPVESAKTFPATSPAPRRSAIQSRTAYGGTIPSNTTGGENSTSVPKNEPIAAPAETWSRPSTERSRSGFATNGVAAMTAAAAATTAPSARRLGRRSASRPPSQ
jgi:hypothetical protein